VACKSTHCCSRLIRSYVAGIAASELGDSVDVLEFAASNSERLFSRNFDIELSSSDS